MSGLKNIQKWLADFFNGSDGKVRITPESVLSIPAVAYSIKKISGDFSQLPLELKEGNKKDGFERIDHLWDFALNVCPNNYQTPNTFKETLMGHSLMFGNCQAAIFPGIQELVPFDPHHSIPLMSGGEKFHVTCFPTEESKQTRLYQLLKDSVPSEMDEPKQNGIPCYSLRDENVLHVPGFGFDGVCGMNVAKLHSGTFKAALYASAHRERRYRKGNTAEIILEVPKGMLRDPKEAEELRSSFEKRNSGENGDSVGLLREGITANAIQMSARDAQEVELAAESRREIALTFLIEAITGDDSSVSYNSLSMKMQAYLRTTLATWLRKWESECRKKLLRRGEMQRMMFKFDEAELIKGDIEQVAKVAKEMKEARIWTNNECREFVGSNPVEGGDIFENPNIDVKESDVEQARAAIRGQLENMIGIEAKRCLEHVTEQNYLDWADNFYGKWESKLGDVIEKAGGDRKLATEHCKESKSALLAATGVQADQLEQSIKSVVGDWKERAETLTEKIFKKE